MYLLLLLLVPGIGAQFDRSTCGSGKGCVTYPNGCQQLGNCRLYFSYLQDSDQTVSMEIFGLLDSTAQSQYYAVGFSADQSMGDDTVVFCRYQPSTSPQVQVGLAYNTAQRQNSILSSTNIQQVNSTTVVNGGLYCSWRQVVAAGVQGVKNLNDSFYILVAYGTPQNDGSLSYHLTNRAVMPSRVDLRQYVKSGSTVIVIPMDGTSVQPFSLNRSLKDWLKIIHAIFMTCSWGILLSTGIIFARHFKDHWPESKICGVRMWFVYHRSLNTMGLVLSILGVVAIFWTFDWTWQGPQPGWSLPENTSVGPLHCLFGAIAFVVAWFQPINAICRCKSESAARFVFNWIHRLLGLFALLCALTAITITAFSFNTMFYSMDAATALWSAYLAVLLVTELLLEILKVKKWCTSTVVPEKENLDGGGAAAQPVSGFSNAQSYLLLFYFIVTVILLLAFCVLIFMKPVRAG